MTAIRRLPIFLALVLLASCTDSGTTVPSENTVSPPGNTVPNEAGDAGDSRFVGDGTDSGEDLAATAIIRDRENAVIGTAALTETDDGVRLDAEITDFPAGEHGFHIHETGRCELPDFESAGGHFNPTGEDHGDEDTEGSHLGDMDNLIVSDEGSAHVTRTIDGATLADGPLSLLRSGGTAVVIHQRPDDYETDPSGAAGPRLACGVFEGEQR